MIFIEILVYSSVHYFATKNGAVYFLSVHGMNLSCCWKKQANAVLVYCLWMSSPGLVGIGEPCLETQPVILSLGTRRFALPIACLTHIRVVWQATPMPHPGMGVARQTTSGVFKYIPILPYINNNNNNITLKPFLLTSTRLTCPVSLFRTGQWPHADITYIATL